MFRGDANMDDAPFRLTVRERGDTVDLRYPLYARNLQQLQSGVEQVLQSYLVLNPGATVDPIPSHVWDWLRDKNDAVDFNWTLAMKGESVLELKGEVP